jgi:hypothetical protein
MPSTAFRNYKPPARRPLLVYAFDPTLGRKLNNYITVAYRTKHCGLDR